MGTGYPLEGLVSDLYSAIALRGDAIHFHNVDDIVNRLSQSNDPLLLEQGINDMVNPSNIGNTADSLAKNIAVLTEVERDILPNITKHIEAMGLKIDAQRTPDAPSLHR